MGIRVLFVTSHSDSRWSKVVGELIAQYGTLAIMSHIEAYASAQDWSCSAVILEDNMSDNLLQFVNTFRALHPSTPILIATTSQSWTRARKFFMAGATDYIFETFDRSALLQTLSLHLGRAMNAIPSEIEEG